MAKPLNRIRRIRLDFPYLVGTGISLLSILVFWLADKPLGMSTALSQASGACASVFMGWEKVGQNAYWAKHVPKWDYGTWFLVGTFLGALAAAVIGKKFRIESVPDVWRERFGPSVGKRMAGTVMGGVLCMYGARLAGGCTSGHGISGSLQLAVGSWTFYALSFPWVAKHILPVGDVGKLTLAQLTGLPVWAVFALLALVAAGVFRFIHKLEQSRRS